jgi:hypothetical protein
MTHDDGTTSDKSCPYIDHNDPRCASSFTLGRLDRAFDVCLRRPLACQVFYRIAIEQRGSSPAWSQGQVPPQPRPGLVPVTLAGQALRAAG